LAAQQQVLEHEVLTRANRHQHGREEQPKQFRHALSIGDLRSRGFAVPQLLVLQGDTSEGRAWCEAALARPQATRLHALRARVLFGAGQLAWDQGDLLAARDLLEASVACADVDHDRWREQTLYTLGEVLWELGDQERSRAVAEECVASAAAGHAWELGLALDVLGTHAFWDGNLADARQCHEESLKQLHQVGDPSPAAYVGRHLGYVAAAEGRRDEALRHFITSLAVNQRLGDMRGTFGVLAALVGLAATREHAAIAAQLSGALAIVLEQAGAPTLNPRDRALYERALALVRDVLGADGFAAECEAGRALSLETALAHALSSLQPAAAS
jgi:tetratricopeptide (TPR) repeat protein